MPERQRLIRPVEARRGIMGQPVGSHVISAADAALLDKLKAGRTLTIGSVHGRIALTDETTEVLLGNSEVDPYLAPPEGSGYSGEILVKDFKNRLEMSDQ